MTAVSVSDPSDPNNVMNALRDNYNQELRDTPNTALVQSLCAAVGSVGQFPANDYMCGGVVVSTVDGQDSYGLPVLYNVRSDGTTYYVGSPCLESTPASGCDGNYWSLVKSEALTAAVAPTTTTTTTTASTPAPTSCGALDVPGGDPSRYSNITASGLSCSDARGLAKSFSLPGTQVPTSPAADGVTCAPTNDATSQLVAQCTSDSAEVNLYSNQSS